MNKEVCKHCFEHVDSCDVAPVGWGVVQEQLWNKGLVDCPDNWGPMIENKGEPPDDCLYKLEHLVISNE